MKLTDTQLVLLSAAAQRQGGAVEFGAEHKGRVGSVAHQSIGTLLSGRLVEEFPHKVYSHRPSATCA